MPKRPVRAPKLTHHKPSGRARVRIEGKDYWLGKHGTPEADEAYRRTVAEYIATGKPPKPRRQAERESAGLTVVELADRYKRHCDGYYRKNGVRTSRYDVIRSTMRIVREMYGSTPAAEFGPLKLKAVRAAMVERGWTRLSINERVGEIRRCFKWGVENELVSPITLQALQAVAGLRKGRTEATESKPVRPVAEANVNAVLPHVSKQVGDMIRLQLLTGCRPGEVVLVRPCDVDRGGDVWEFVPASHKTEHHGKSRRIYIGPKAQAVLAPYLDNRPAEAFCFSPIEAEADRLAERHAARKTPMRCGNRPGTNRRRKPRKKPGERYTSASYRRAVHTGCIAAEVDQWSPNRLRHTRATILRREYGIEAAQTILGHANLSTTEVYAEADAAKARKIMEEIG